MRRRYVEVPIGKEAAERWGCRDCSNPKCHPDMCVTGAPVFDWDVPESFDKVGWRELNRTRSTRVAPRKTSGLKQLKGVN